jgi:DNA-directed RNA polymerase specialized sigma24 family protein
MQVRRRIIDLVRKFRGPQSPVALRATNVVRHADGDIIRSEQAAASVTAPSLLDDWEGFHRVVDSLPEKMKTTFSMRFYLAAKPTNIAQTLGCDVRTVRRYWDAAMEEIRKKLKDTA